MYDIQSIPGNSREPAMKTLRKTVGAIVAAPVVLLLVLRITGLNPHDRTPGLWLTGNLVTAPVTDWSFTDKVETVKVQTRDFFGLPHSVTTYCVAYNGQFYLTSVYPPRAPQYPHGRRWNENVARDPHVRIKIGDQLYDRTLVYVTDPEERAAVIQNKAKKYPQQRIAPGSYINVFHVVPDEERAPD
jgi:hypothetical protein